MSRDSLTHSDTVAEGAPDDDFVVVLGDCDSVAVPVPVEDPVSVAERVPMSESVRVMLRVFVSCIVFDRNRVLDSVLVNVAFGFEAVAVSERGERLVVKTCESVAVGAVFVNEADRETVKDDVCDAVRLH